MTFDMTRLRPPDERVDPRWVTIGRAQLGWQSKNDRRTKKFGIGVPDEAHPTGFGDPGHPCRRDRVIWRAVISGLAIEGSIPLACDLARLVALGEVCGVADPLHQPWLLAEGRDHFVRLCADCHGAEGTGSGKSTASSPLPLQASHPT